MQCNLVTLVPMFRVRHEAGEALGAIGTAACLKELQQYLEDPCLEVHLWLLRFLCQTRIYRVLC